MEVIALMPHIWILSVATLAFALVGMILWRAAGREVRVEEHRWNVSYLAYSGTRADTGPGIVAVILWAVAALCLIITAIVLIPYDAKYYMFYRASGTVESVTNSFEDGSGELSYTPVARLSGYDENFVLTDSRIMALQGRDVDLTCTYSWRPFALDVVVCSVAGVRE